MQMSQGFPGSARESADDPPRRLLLFQTKHGFAAPVLESQPQQRGHQLMNNRLGSFACRMEAISGIGVKQSASTPSEASAISIISGFSAHRMPLARVCPTGAS